MSDEQRRFSEAEVEAILRKATARQDGGALSRDELADVLRQMNLDESALEDAISEVDAERDLAADIDAWKRKRRKAFQRHATSFALVMTLLLGVNLLASPQVLWFLWPLLGWGIGLLSHYLALRRGPDLERLPSVRRRRAEREERARRRAERGERRAKNRAADEALARASEELRDAVKVGVAGVMESVGKALRDAATQPESAPPERTRVRVEPDAAARRREVSDEEVAEEIESLRERMQRKRG